MPKNVPWWIFAGTVAVVASFCGFLYWQIDGVRTTVEDVRTHVAVVENDTAWIKSALETKTAMSRP